MSKKSQRERHAAASATPAKPPGPVAARPDEKPALTPQGFDYKKLALASPLAEFEAYGRQKVKTAQRLGDADVDILLEAFELGRELLLKKTEAGS